MREETREKRRRVHRVFERVAQRYDAANHRISLGRQSSWKRMLAERVKADAPEGFAVLDVCCGTGDIAGALAASGKCREAVGLDFSKAMLREARRKFAALHRLRFVYGDACRLPFADARFDAAVISFGLRNTEDYARVLSEMTRVVRKGGYVYVLDSFLPGNRLLRFFHGLYFRHAMPIIGGGMGFRREYRWLWESTRRFLTPKALSGRMHDAGLMCVKRKNRMFGACVLVWGRKPMK